MGLKEEVEKYVQIAGMSIRVDLSAEMAMVYDVPIEQMMSFYGADTYLVKTREGYLLLTEAREVDDFMRVVHSEIIEHRCWQELAFAVAHAIQLVACYRIGCHMDIEEFQPTVKQDFIGTSN